MDGDTTPLDWATGRVQKLIASRASWSPAEKLMLSQMQEALADWEQARRILQTQGMITEGSQGQPVPHPAQAIKVSAADRVSRWLRQLGLLDDAADVLDELDENKKRMLGL